MLRRLGSAALVAALMSACLAPAAAQSGKSGSGILSATNPSTSTLIADQNLCSVYVGAGLSAGLVIAATPDNATFTELTALNPGTTFPLAPSSVGTSGSAVAYLVSLAGTLNGRPIVGLRVTALNASGSASEMTTCVRSSSPPTFAPIATVTAPPTAAPTSTPAPGATLTPAPATTFTPMPVSVTNFPPSQTVTAGATFPVSLSQTLTTSITNFPSTQNVNGSVSVLNFPTPTPVVFPTTQNVSGSLSITNFPTSAPVTFPSSLNVTATSPLPVLVGNFPTSAPVVFPSSLAVTAASPLPITGTVNVGNFTTPPPTVFPTSLAVTATSPLPVSVAFPASQTVNGSVTVANFATAPPVVFPSNQPVSIASPISIANFPTSQIVAFASPQPVTIAQTLSAAISNFPSVQPVSIASPVAVTGTFFQTTQPVSLATTVPVSIAATLPVSGVFFQPTQPVSIATTVPVSIASTVPVTGTFFQTTQPVSIATTLPVSVLGASSNKTDAQATTTTNAPVDASLFAFNGTTMDRLRTTSSQTTGILEVSVCDPTVGTLCTSGVQFNADAIPTTKFGLVTGSVPIAYNGTSFDRVRKDAQANGGLYVVGNGGNAQVTVAANATGPVSLGTTAMRIMGWSVLVPGTNANLTIYSGTTCTAANAVDVIGGTTANPAAIIGYHGSTAYQPYSTTGFVACGASGSPSVTFTVNI